MQRHICHVHACLDVTCGNDRDILRATAETRGWNGNWNKSQHRKLTLEKKFLPPLLQLVTGSLLAIQELTPGKKKKRKKEKEKKG